MKNKNVVYLDCYRAIKAERRLALNEKNCLEKLDKFRDKFSEIKGIFIDLRITMDSMVKAEGISPSFVDDMLKHIKLLSESIDSYIARSMSLA